MSIAQQVYDAIESDDDGDNTARIASTYKHATPRERAILDDVFMSLCGWSLKTLIGRERDEVDL